MTSNGRNQDDVPRTVHDGLFKSVFSDAVLAAEELHAVLPPALAARIDWPTMHPAPTSFVDPVFRQLTSDLVFHARFLGSGEVLLWLLEHQSPHVASAAPASNETGAGLWRWWFGERVLMG